MTNSPLKLWTAMITPFLKGAVDYESFHTLMKAQKEAGNGVLLLGSTGEAFSISEEERKHIIREMVGRDTGIPIMVGATGLLIEDVLEWISYCNSYPLTGYLCAVPPYIKPGIEGQYGWFKKLLDAAAHPVMLYNNPSRCGTPLHPETLRKLRGHPNLWGLKDSSGSPDIFAQFQQIAPELLFYVGDDNQLLPYAPLHPNGLVSVMANAWPDATRSYVDLCLSGKSPHLSIWEVFSKASNPLPIKALCYTLGWIRSPETRLPLDHHDFSDYALIESALKFMQDWLIEIKD